MKHNNKLSTMQARAIIAECHAINPATICATSQGIISRACALCNEIIDKYPRYFNRVDFVNYVALCASTLAKILIENNILTCLEYIAFFAQHKRNIEKSLNDFGAFGDLFEILVRVALLQNLNIIRPAHLTVKQALTTDVISKKYGKIEVGHNGKTFAEGIPADYMFGNYTAFIYGVFDDFTKARVYDACARYDIKTALEIIRAYTAIFANKYDFIPTLQAYRRGKIVTIKSGKVMVQYNESLYHAFCAALDDNILTTL